MLFLSFMILIFGFFIGLFFGFKVVIIVKGEGFVGW